MKDGKFGFGIIGCGVIGPWHARAIKANTETATLVAACDILPDKLQKLRSEYGDNLAAYTDYYELLKNPNVDIVSICTPSGLHGEMAVAAANAGKHILCEKPLEIDLGRLDRMIEAAEKNKVKLAGIFQRRTYQSSKKVKQAIEAGELGKMILGDAYMKYYRSQAYYDSAGWRGTRALDGGGALMNQGVHGIDLLLWLMGDVDSVYARSRTMVRDIEVEDTAVAMLQYKSGAMGIIEGTTSVNPGEATTIQLHGKLGTIIYEESDVKRWAVATGDDDRAKDISAATEEEAAGGTADPKDIGVLGHIRHVADLIEAIEEDRDPMVTGPGGRKAVEMILAIYKSSDENREIKLPL
ncbi:Gfo/Idh/MocA family oxidoreductase [candidate division KSB1 bacterium]|nr:Gfo/Idh/MocA family oxidoreductase [candidate division KSB1 bacterium]